MATSSSNCPPREMVLLAVYPERATGVPTVSVVTSDGAYADSLKALNDKLKSCRLVQCEQIGDMTANGYCYLLYTFEPETA